MGSLRESQSAHNKGVASDLRQKQGWGRDHATSNLLELEAATVDEPQISDAIENQASRNTWPTQEQRK